MNLILLNVFLIYPPGQEIAQGQRPGVQIIKEKNEEKLELKEGVTISVESFDFQGNKAVKTEDLERLVAPYLNRPLAQSEIHEIYVRIKALYRQQGFSDAEVYAEKPKVKSHSLTIIVKEGRA